MVAEALLIPRIAWNLKLRHNLNNLETNEWAANLSHFVSMIRIRNCNDLWSWLLNPSHAFSVKSLMEDLSGASDPIVGRLYKVIWKDVYPTRRLKHFFGSLLLELLI